MPSRSLKFVVLDTSVYIENFRTGRFTLRLLQAPFIPRCSSVVLHELVRGARSVHERRFVRDLFTRCQIVTPTSEHWLKAAEILAAMRRREGYDSNKIRDLSFDVLIALSARSIGAVVITCNASDFQAIRKYVSFHLLCWD